MIFHENRLLADDSHEISNYFFLKIRKDVAKFVVCCNPDWRFESYTVKPQTFELLYFEIFYYWKQIWGTLDSENRAYIYELF